nr:hypothetical protein [Bacillaceae bacterium]
MTKKLENLYFLFKIDFKQAGSVFFFPAIMWLVSVLQLIMQNPPNESDRLNSIILFQGIYLPFAGWGLMYRLKEIYEDGASETLFPYYRSYLIIDISRYLSIHFIGTMIWCLFFSMKYSFAIIWPIHMIHFFLITLLFMFLGTALILIIKNIEFSLTVLFVYAVIELATLGEYMPWPHVFIFRPAIMEDIQLIYKLISICIYIVILFFTTLFLIRKSPDHSIK